MKAEEYIEAKQFASAGKVNIKDALIAIEIAVLEAKIETKQHMLQAYNLDKREAIDIRLGLMRNQEHLQVLIKEHKI